MTERLFLALWPNDRVKAQIEAAATGLIFDAGRKVASCNYHVTLAFLGDSDATRRACIEQVAASIRSRSVEFVLTVAQWRRKTGILWLAADEVPEQLVELTRSLQTSLVHCGYSPERRPFRLHVTLARDVARAPSQQKISPIRWSADAISLVSSRLTPQGPQYTVVKEWPLTKPA